MITTYDSRKSRFSLEDNSTVIFKLVFFILWPFGSWILALRSANTRSSFIIFFLFSLLICWHMSPTGYTDGYDDFLGILDRFFVTNYNDSQIAYDLNAYLSGEDNAPKEMYENVMIWFTKSIVGNNYHFYFLLAALPIAFCQLKCIRRIVLDTRYQANTFYALMILALFIMPRDIVTVQNPRFATGFWVCTMSSLAFFCDRRLRLLWAALISISPFFHSAMIIYVALFYAAVIIPKRKTRWLEICAYISIPFMFFDADFFSNIGSSLTFLPSSIQGWAERYMSDEAYAKFVAGEGRAGFWWVSTIFDVAIKGMYILMTLQLIRNKEAVNANSEAKSFYPVYLMLFSAINMIQFVPVLGGRYYWCLQVYCVFVWFKAFYPTRKKTAKIMLCCWSWFIARRYLYFMGGALAITTPLDLFISPLPYLIGKGLWW